MTSFHKRLAQEYERELAARSREPGKFSYEVLLYESELFNGLDGYVSLGVWRASGQRPAANKALRALAEDPFDSEGAAIATPDPSVIVVPLSRLVPLEGLKIPQRIIDAFKEG